MSEYQVIARKYRPRQFKEVIGQESIVTTLQNALKFRRLSHAYLFCGSKGTGKTTLARIFAKAMNCHFLDENQEPCNQCNSCKEIMAGNSLDYIEIDGASHRGIEDIRQINETIAYVPQSGKYRIYLIDEVHMLTKEAFNALLKTLEEPPATIKFFFATTESHKIPSTILSRCQRFNLNRIPTEKIIYKLQSILNDLGIESDLDALHLISQLSEGGLRDAEVLLDQVLAFNEDKITVHIVSDVLGLVPKEKLFNLDEACQTGNILIAFEIVQQIFSTGKNVTHFLEELAEHYRTHLLFKINGINKVDISTQEKQKYLQTNSYYTQEQCLYVLDLLIAMQEQFRLSAFKRTALEILLIKIIRSSYRIHLDALVNRLNELEKNLQLSTKKLDISQPIIFDSKKKESLSEDPSPKVTDLPQLKITSSIFQPIMENKITSNQKKESHKEDKAVHFQRKPAHDTLMRFAAKELEGNLSLKK